MTKGSIERKSKHIANIERLRILAICGVVSYHTHSAIPRSIGVVGFIILLLAFCAFVVNRTEPLDFTKLAKRKAQRLLKPWFFWSIMYGCLGLAKIKYMNIQFSEVFPAEVLFTGTRLHLWFLTFAFVAALFLNMMHRTTIRIPHSVKITTAILIGALCVFCCALIQAHTDIPTPVRQWMLALPGIPLGFAIGQTLLLKMVKSRLKFYVLASLSMFITCAVLTWLGYNNLFALRYLISVAIICSAFYWQGNLDPVSKKIALLTYGIYLIHPMAVILLEQLGIATGYPWVLLLLVVTISSVTIFILQKTPIKQFV